MSTYVLKIHHTGENSSSRNVQLVEPLKRKPRKAGKQQKKNIYISKQSKKNHKNPEGPRQTRKTHKKPIENRKGR